jgi:hypothetical protein
MRLFCCCRGMRRIIGTLVAAALATTISAQLDLSGTWSVSGSCLDTASARLLFVQCGNDIVMAPIDSNGIVVRVGGWSLSLLCCCCAEVAQCADLSWLWLLLRITHHTHRTHAHTHTRTHASQPATYRTL